MVHIDCLEMSFNGFFFNKYATVSQGRIKVHYKTHINTFNKYILSIKNEP